MVRDSSAESARPISCRLCKAGGALVAYDGPIRAGGVGSGLVDGFRVLTCPSCDATFLDPLPHELRTYYESDDYWSSRSPTGSVDIGTLKHKADSEQGLWLNAIGTSTFRDKVVLEIGSGSGSFLDHVTGLASETIGVEASATLGQELPRFGHRHIKALSEVPVGIADVVVSFDTLEHAPDPAYFLHKARSALVAGGEIYVGVPNRADFLTKIAPAYLRHYYHTSHLWYFSGRRLRSLLAEVGFVDVVVQGVHKYDLMNMVVWLREGVGRGVVGGDVFDDFAEASFRRELERQHLSSHLLCRAAAPAGRVEREESTVEHD